MRRFARTLALVASFTLIGLGMPGVAKAATTATPAACTAGVQVDSFTLAPPSVRPGQPATATVVGEGCTGQSQRGSAMWYGRFTGADAGFPPGCPALDPLVLPVDIPASGQFTSSLGYSVPAPCTATALQVTVTIR